jgi:hypothetical protein
LIAAHLQARARRLTAAIADLMTPTLEAMAALPETAKQSDQDTTNSNEEEPEEINAA